MLTIVLYNDVHIKTSIPMYTWCHHMQTWNRWVNTNAQNSLANPPSDNPFFRTCVERSADTQLTASVGGGTSLKICPLLDLGADWNLGVIFI